MIPRLLIPEWQKSWAETHYKFKLPWSPLSKPWPEIFLDGPTYAVPGEHAEFYLVVKDADYFPIKVVQLKISLQWDGHTQTRDIPLDINLENQFNFIPGDLNLPNTHAPISINAAIEVVNSRGKSREILNSNLPGLERTPLSFKFLQDNMPWPQPWGAGEMHCHSYYSSDPVEFGAPPHVLQKAAKTMGHQFVTITDHSYDFYYDQNRYMRSTNPNEKWQNYVDEVIALNGPDVPVMIPGEEVSCGNSEKENVHMLVMGHHEFIEGHGDGGRRWFNNRPDLSIAEVRSLIGNLPAFAAHPKAKPGILEKAIFRRGDWSSPDLSAQKGLTVSGLQFWNGHTGRDFSLGRAFWVSELLKGNRLMPIGSTDAHGDLNMNTGVKTPLFSLYQSRNHVFGTVKTLFPIHDHTIVGVQAGMASGKAIATDGPFAWLEQSGASLKIQARSNEDWGGLYRINLFTGAKNESREEVLLNQEFESNDTFEWEQDVDLPIGIMYVRVEIHTNQSKRAITSALFLN